MKFSCKLQPLTFDKTVEGSSTLEFMYHELSKIEYDFQDKLVLEVGPKHGLHTEFIDKCGQPKSITCVELSSKESHINQWRNRIFSPFNIVYNDLLKYESDQKFDFVLFAGVLYHNNEQLRLLKKLRSMSNDNTIMVFESSTTRNKDLQDKNVIEVHWPERFRNVSTIIFHPSKQACKSMLEMSGWEIISSSDDSADMKSEERVNYLCKASKTKLVTYEDVDHDHISDAKPKVKINKNALAKQLVNVFVRQTLTGGNGTSIQDAWQYWDQESKDDELKDLERLISDTLEWELDIEE